MQKIRFQDENAVGLSAEAKLNNAVIQSNHKPMVMKSGLRVKCCVRTFEEGLQSVLRKISEGQKQLEEAMGIPVKYI
jgi:hypothetical protein